MTDRQLIGIAKRANGHVAIGHDVCFLAGGYEAHVYPLVAAYWSSRTHEWRADTLESIPYYELLDNDILRKRVTKILGKE